MRHAMILAAGRGQRMRPLTDTCPKPMLAVGGKPLIQWHIEALVQAGFSHLVVNHAWLGSVIESRLGDGSAFQARVRYSAEAEALETAGGIAKALPLLGVTPFPVINGDVFTDWPRQRLRSIVDHWKPGQLAHLVLVPNPMHHPEGDFILTPSGQVQESKPEGGQSLGEVHTLTFSGLGVYSPALFASVPEGQPAKLAPLLRQAMRAGAVQGERHDGLWEDVGTPERLAELNERIKLQ